MDSGTGDAAVSRTSAVRAGGRAVVAAGTGTGTMKMAAQWTDARRAMGRLHRCGPRRPPESSANSPGTSFSASDDRASRPSAGAALSRAVSVACYAAAALLVAFAAILALPLQAQAQTASNDATPSALALATASAASVALSPTFQAESHRLPCVRAERYGRNHVDRDEERRWRDGDDLGPTRTRPRRARPPSRSRRVPTRSR